MSVTALVADASGTEAHDGPPLRPLAELTAELGSLAAEIAARTCRFLRLLAEFDARRGFEAEGVGSTTHWLSWRCGMSTTTAREHLRIARRLADLPQTAEQFAEGRLSFSKVRAITRVATAETESELLDVAASATANQLDRVVAGVRTATPLAEINERHDRRHLTFRHDDDGSVTFSGRCSPEEGAAILEQLRLVQDYLARTVSREEQVSGGRALIDALVLLCEQSDLTPLVDATDPLTAEAALGSRRAETVLQATLDDLQRAVDAPAGAPARSGHPEHPGRPDIGSRLEHGPALHPETARRLCCDTAVVLHLHEPAGGVRVVPHARPGRTLDLGRLRRLASRRQLRTLWDRDHGCRFPGCERRRFLHAHHIQHWADGGRTDLDNLVLLCGQHHRLLHEDGFDIELGDQEETVLDPHGRRRAAVPRHAAVVQPEPSSHHAPAGRVLPLDPVGGGPLDLDHTVGVIAERWALRSAV